MIVILDAYRYNMVMTKTHSSKGVVWIDMESPDDSEISSVLQRYNLHSLVGEELKNSTSMAKINFFKDYVLVVLTLPVRTKNESGDYIISEREIDFVIGKNFLITSRYEAVDQLEYFSKIFEANNILSKEERTESACKLFYFMVKRFYQGMRDDLKNIEDALVSSETRIFNGDERKMVEVLSYISRELIDFKQTARVHRDVWIDMLTHADHPIFDKDFETYIKDIENEFNRTRELITNSSELLIDLRETNNSLLDTKQNEIIKVLTLVAFIFYPLTFIAAIFTIPASKVPFIESPSGWGVIMFIMALVAVCIWWVFKKKRWVN
jgi:magnesium transporter